MTFLPYVLLIKPKDECLSFSSKQRKDHEHPGIYLSYDKKKGEKLATVVHFKGSSEVIDLNKFEDEILERIEWPDRPNGGGDIEVEKERKELTQFILSHCKRTPDYTHLLLHKDEKIQAFERDYLGRDIGIDVSEIEEFKYKLKPITGSYSGIIVGKDNDVFEKRKRFKNHFYRKLTPGDWDVYREPKLGEKKLIPGQEGWFDTSSNSSFWSIDAFNRTLSMLNVNSARERKNLHNIRSIASGQEYSYFTKYLKDNSSYTHNLGYGVVPWYQDGENHLKIIRMKDREEVKGVVETYLGDKLNEEVLMEPLRRKIILSEISAKQKRLEALVNEINNAYQHCNYAIVGNYFLSQMRGAVQPFLKIEKFFSEFLNPYYTDYQIKKDIFQWESGLKNIFSGMINFTFGLIIFAFLIVSLPVSVPLLKNKWNFYSGCSFSWFIRRSLEIFRGIFQLITYGLVLPKCAIRQLITWHQKNEQKLLRIEETPLIQQLVKKARDCIDKEDRSEELDSALSQLDKKYTKSLERGWQSKHDKTNGSSILKAQTLFSRTQSSVKTDCRISITKELNKPPRKIESEKIMKSRCGYIDTDSDELHKRRPTHQLVFSEEKEGMVSWRLYRFRVNRKEQEDITDDISSVSSEFKKYVESEIEKIFREADPDAYISQFQMQEKLISSDKQLVLEKLIQKYEKTRKDDCINNYLDHFNL